MSQVSIVDIEGNNPQIPTRFNANVGFAIPIANVLEIHGAAVAAGSTPVQTVGSGNTITTNVQISQAIAATDATKIGLAAFDSADFTVDANGFVSLIAGPTTVESFNVDASTAPGTDPVVPSGAGVVTVTGAQVAAGVVGTNVIRTNSLLANTYAIEIQRAAAAAASTVASNGVAHFNSANFTVDGNGFVSLLGGGAAIDSIAVQAGTSPIVPTVAGLVTINGAVVAAGTNPVRTNGTGANTMAVEVQISQAIAAADATKIGLANFSSADFAVAATGFVTLSSTGAGKTITGQSGGALSPTANNWNIFGAAVAAGTSPVSTSGSGSTLTTNVQISQAIAATDATKVGLCNFNSTQFSVDANGFVTLAGAGQAIDSIGTQTGTNPIVPTVAGLVTINGSVVAAGTNPFRSNGTGANTMALEVQISQAIAATDATKIGLSNFNSAHFSVDANGFVSLVGGGEAIDSIAVDAATAPGTNPVLPSVAGIITVTGGQVAAGTVGANVIRSNSTAANAYTMEIQRSTAVASTASVNNGVSHFNSANFTVDSNGFVSILGTTAGTGTTVGAVTANIITIALGGVAGTFEFEARVKGFNSSTPAGAGYKIYGTFRTDGATATLIGYQQIFNEEAALTAADAYFIASGNNAILQVLGVAALTINWSAQAAQT